MNIISKHFDLAKIQTGDFALFNNDTDTFVRDIKNGECIIFRTHEQALHNRRSKSEVVVNLACFNVLP